ncbi:MAG: ATPase/protein kinase [Bdellovibrionales bacterium GWA2_49_15]|nr:MAG: ATPase/protein kinase [Bdellovibrionales bacterium GWA2_49_15]HAZ12785.1 methylmalonyl Co-A mutase-associated GTPase MeaB [Bdellovibrionales bacterium]
MVNVDISKLLTGDTRTLARAITLVESQNPQHRRASKKLLKAISNLKRSSFRISISGAPGAGKSTLIEALGLHLVERGHKVAVLTIDPTSPISGGSILGDKIRMEKLSAHPQAFIRPSPTGLHLGGATNRTREVILLCESAGFDIIMVETVGVGQTEYQVKNMVDAFVLAVSPLSGDSIQGMKKGILELADLILVTKADGASKNLAEITLNDYKNSMQLKMRSDQWSPPVMTASSVEKTGISELWEHLQNYLAFKQASGALEKDRLNQKVLWTQDLCWEAIQAKLKPKLESPSMQKKILKMLSTGKMNPEQAATIILKQVNPKH